jgi:DNA-binding NtrC family response regulator
MALDFIVNQVVLVEDDLDILKETKEVLLNSGLAKNVHSFTSGFDAVRYIKSNSNIDLVITDYYMDGGDGGDVINHVISTTYNDKGRHLPIIVITGHSEVKEMENRSKGLKVLIKPIKFKELHDQIHEMISNQELYLLKSSMREIQSIIKNISNILNRKKEEV